MIDKNPFTFDLILKETKISSCKEFTIENLMHKLPKPLTGSDYKFYILTLYKKVLYNRKSKSSFKSTLNSEERLIVKMGAVA
jgi:hypothetical protein